MLKLINKEILIYFNTHFFSLSWLMFVNLLSIPDVCKHCETECKYSRRECK